MANWSLPTLASLYSDFLAQSKERDEDAIKMLDGTTSTNLPSGAKRWNATGNKFEKWNGTVWSDLSTLYEIKVRDSDRLNGQPASYYAVSGHGHTNATTSVAGFMSSTDKSKLDAIAANANNYSHPTSDGNLHVPSNGTANNGKFLQATAVAGVYTWASLPTSSLSTLGITATAAELNTLDGITATTAELNILDGCLIAATQLNYLSALSGNVQTQLNAKAPLNSAALTGTPTAPTAAVGTNTTQLATTAFVLANRGSITTTAVGAATAGLSAGSVGSYIFANDLKAEINAFGVTVPGSRLQASSANSAYSGTAVTGTWRCMGSGSSNYAILYLRIA